jgi:hypothetical protein
MHYGGQLTTSSLSLILLVFFLEIMAGHTPYMTPLHQLSSIISMYGPSPLIIFIDYMALSINYLQLSPCMAPLHPFYLNT